MKKMSVSKKYLTVFLLLGCSGHMMAMKKAIVFFGLGAAGAAGAGFFAGRQTAPEKLLSEKKVRTALDLEKDKDIPKNWLQLIKNREAREVASRYKQDIKEVIGLGKFDTMPVNWKADLKKELADYKTTKEAICDFTGTKQFDPAKLPGMLNSKVTDGQRKIMSLVIQKFEPGKNYRIVADEYGVDQNKELDILLYLDNQLQNNYEKK